jgi:hypothetical protein
VREKCEREEVARVRGSDIVERRTENKKLRRTKQGEEI